MKVYTEIGVDKMDNMSLVSVLFYSIPESILIFSFGTIITGRKINRKNIIVAAILSVLIAYIVRQLPIPFGVHMFIGLLTIIALFKVILKFPTKVSIFAALVSMATLLTLENTILQAIQQLVNRNIEEILMNKSWERPFMGFPHLIVWALLCLFLKSRKTSLLGGSQNDSV